MTERCGECKHLRLRTIEDHVCKLNCVSRRYNDPCCWDTKKYPSRFEPKVIIICEWCTKQDLISTARHQYLTVNVFGRDHTICRDCYDRLVVVE